jgi:Domain of unknown function (DUF4292)
MTRYLILCISVLCFFSMSCRRQKLKKSIIEIRTNNETKPDLENNASVVLEKINEKFSFKIPTTDFETCKIKSKISINSSKLRQTIPANINIKKDSVIWISVSLMLEVARVNITPDTIQILDKLNRKYYGTSFKSLSKMFDFDIDFQILQSALLGNLPIKPNKEDIYSDENNFLKLSQKRKEVTFENKFEKENLKLYLIDAKDASSQAEMQLAFKNYIKESDRFIPTLIQILFTSTQKGEQTSIDFEHTKFDFLDRNLRFPFNVPKGYDVEEMPGLKN